MQNEIHLDVEFYQSLIEDLPVEIAIYNEEGRFTYANKATRSFFKSKNQEIAGKTFNELFSEKTASEQHAVRKQVFESGMEIRVSRDFILDGKPNYFSILHKPVKDNQGKVNAVMVVGTNITEQVRQEKLFEVQQQIDSLSNLTPNLTGSLKKAFQYLMEIDWVDAGGVYLYEENNENLKLVYSQGLSDNYIKSISVFSQSQPSAFAKTSQDILKANKRTFLEPVKNVMIKEGLTFAINIPLKFKKEIIGNLILGSKTISELSVHDRRIIESIAARIANLISIVKTKEQLISTNIKLNRSLYNLATQSQMLMQKSRLESLGELSAGLAHEINQPLSVISLVMENVNYKMQSGMATKEYLAGKFENIYNNINKIKQLIDHVRLFSRDQGNVIFDKIDVNNVINAALSMIGIQIKNQQIDLRAELSPSLGYTLGNPSRLEQVLLNLLSNSALQFESAVYMK